MEPDQCGLVLFVEMAANGILDRCPEFGAATLPYCGRPCLHPDDTSGVLRREKHPERVRAPLLQGANGGQDPHASA